MEVLLESFERASRRAKKLATCRVSPEEWDNMAMRAAIFENLQEDFKKESGLKGTDLDNAVTDKRNKFKDG